ncbi:glycerophosphodiester phosphodiesterase family protein [Phytoactinopolyspora halotolerans]|uniref:Esterase n=1 Tax=Phytoactinopolyspora halotolerans TaxID=1981512 RepID=A0A6L9S228_9ACTN|nr:glycerophosphodiester phosphodiesterase family protein [Phytoactinopolyspora halotolerans]NED99514.1 hypothetical protein [Phytoactinopolyspora halotolerans]
MSTRIGRQSLRYAGLITATLAAATTLAGTGSETRDVGAQPPLPPDRSLAIGHRGSAYKAPEETMAGYRQAVRDRADILEGDVQLTADGHLILMHDATLTRTTDVEERFPDREPWRPGQLTLEEIRTLDARSWFGEAFAGEPVAELDQLLDLAEQTRTPVMLELKQPGNNAGFEQALADELRSRGVGADGDSRIPYVLVAGFDAASLQEFHEIFPGPEIVYQVGDVPDDEALESYREWADHLMLTVRMSSGADVARVETAGFSTMAGTVDSDVDLRMAIGQGYDSIITNHPERALQLQRRNFREPVPQVQVESIYANAPGDDIQPETGEHVSLLNTTSAPIDMSGWTVRDQAGNIVRLPDGVSIDAGSLLRVYSGPGTDRPGHVYADYGRSFLNNSGGETVVIYNRDGEIVTVGSYLAYPG